MKVITRIKSILLNPSSHYAVYSAAISAIVFFFFGSEKLGLLSYTISISFLFSYLLGFNIESKLFNDSSYGLVKGFILCSFTLVPFLLIFFSFDKILFAFFISCFRIIFLQNAYHKARFNYLFFISSIFRFIILPLSIIKENSFGLWLSLITIMLLFSVIYKTGIVTSLTQYYLECKNSINAFKYNAIKYIRNYSDKFLIAAFFNMDVLGFVEIVQKLFASLSILNNMFFEKKKVEYGRQKGRYVFDKKSSLFFILLFFFSWIPLLTSVPFISYLIIQLLFVWFSLPLFLLRKEKLLFLYSIVPLLIIFMAFFFTKTLTSVYFSYYLSEVFLLLFIILFNYKLKNFSIVYTER